MSLVGEEESTRQTRAFPAAHPISLTNARFPFQRRESAKDIPTRVQNERQCDRALVPAPVKVSRAETVAASAPQKRKPLPAELVEERRKGRDDPRVELGSLLHLNASEPHEQEARPHRRPS
jgi:hypothetical protein